MRKYHVVYKSSIDGDCCTVWVLASSVQNAVEQARLENWDIESIIEVY